MKNSINIFFMIFFSILFFCSISFAAPNLNGVMKKKEWTVSDGDPDSTTTRYNSADPRNPIPDTRGNLHVEHGHSYGEYYDAEKLGFYIDDNMLYIGLQSNYDFTDKNNGIPPGDFIFQFTKDTDSLGPRSLYSEITSNSKVALDFSFNDSNKISNLEFRWDNLGFDYPTDHQEELAYNANSSTYFDNDFTFNYAYKPSDSGERHTLELAIDLTTLDNKLQSLFADSNFAQMHWQMGCGNDVLYVADNYDYTQTPEPATLFLFGLGLLGAGAMGRRRQKK